VTNCGKDLKSPDDQVQPEEYVARIVSKVCTWRATSDLDFDLNFVIAINDNIIDKVVEDAADKARNLRKAKNKAEDDLHQTETTENRTRVDVLTDKWREAVESYVLYESGTNLLGNQQCTTTCQPSSHW